MTLNAINQVEKKPEQIGRKGKGKKVVVECNTELTEEQLNEYPTLVKEKKEKARKAKGPDSKQWSKL